MATKNEQLIKARREYYKNWRKNNNKNITRNSGSKQADMAPTQSSEDKP